MAKKTATPPLEQNLYVKELLEVLKTHDPTRLEYLKDMIENTARIEQQLAAAVAEVAVMRRELAAIRDESHPIRNAMKNTIAGIQDKIQALNGQLETLKATIINGCKDTLTAFKEHGALALNEITKYFKIKPALEKIARVSSQAAKENDNSIIQIERISKEYHKAGKHIKNIGRALTGKELITSMKPVGKVAKTIEAPYKAARACNLAIRDAARGALKSLTRLEKIAEHPKSMKEQIETAAKQAAAHNARNTPDKVIAAPTVDI